VTPLPPPGPGAPGDDDDDPGDPGIPEAVPEDWAAPPAGPPAGEPEPAEPAPVTPDPPPGKVPTRAAAGGRGGTPKRVTAAVRADVEGKWGLILEMIGGVWAARDATCGGAFQAQLPAIRPASVELILLSPDLVAWFTGVGGGFMLWFNLLAACWPVGAVIWSHHVAHAGDDDGQAAAPAAAYAA